MKLSNTIVRYSFPTEIHFGSGAANWVSPRLASLGLKRPLVVTDKGLVQQPMFQAWLSSLDKKLETAVFSEIVGNPVLSQLKLGVDSYHRHGADCLVAIGGGAATDVAKAIGLMVNHPGELFDYEDGKPDARPFDKAMPYLMALPTTSGTGSEVGRSTVISDDITKVKKIVFDPILLPRLVLADPDLTLDLPPKITAATGMDALSHLMESFVAKSEHPICDGIALEGLYLLSRSLRESYRAAQDPNHNRDENRRVRGMMMNASMMGAIAFQKGLGVTHSCAHALSAVCDLHHGLANGIMIPFAMAFNLEVCRDRFSRMWLAIDGVKREPEMLIDWLHDLKRELDIPEKLSQVGVKQEHFASLVEHALTDVCHQSNPRACTRADFEGIFQCAL